MIARFLSQLGMLAEYFTTKRPSTRRTLRRSVRYPVALPLSVNVQDFFRKDCLLSKFTVTPDGARALRIRSAELEAVDGVAVKPCRSPNAPVLVVNPRQTATFLFKVIREGEPSHKPTSEPLNLVITYAAGDEGVKDATAETDWRRIVIPVDLPGLDVSRAAVWQLVKQPRY